jgi:3,4-dihydroxy 2-butanone 4-phosphate synthase
LAAFSRGVPAVIHDGDGREGECDIVFPAEYASSARIAKLRMDAGGLICVAVHPESARKLGLGFMADILRSARNFDKKLIAGVMLYGDRPSFSISINHRKTFTGITDGDRSLTISKFAELAKNPDAGRFADEFCTPGHVPLLIGADGLLSGRKGHTELALSLCMESRAAVLCEMLDWRTGKALGKGDAKKYAEENDFMFLEGKEIIRFREGRR